MMIIIKNEVFECPFSTEPKVRTTNNKTKRRKVPDTKNSHAAHTNVSLTSPSLHLHIHTHTRTNVSQIYSWGWRQLKPIGVGDREKVSLELRFKGGKRLSMSHREKKIVPDGKTNEKKAHWPWNLLRLFGIRKMRVSAEERRVRDGLYSSRRSDR